MDSIVFSAKKFQFQLNKLFPMNSRNESWHIGESNMRVRSERDERKKEKSKVERKKEKKREK